jgi:hypothetical protein
MTQRTALAAFRRSIPLFALTLAFFACSDGGSNNNNGNIEGNSLLLNFTSDYTTGELRWMDLNSRILSDGALSFDQDSKVSVAEGNIFILSRNPGALACVLPQSIGDESAIKQNGLTADNPYEATVIGSKGYIALNDADYVEVFNTSTCSPSEKIDLPISSANASTIKASGDTLLVTLQRMENWSATKPGLLVRIKASTKTLIDTIQLKLYNPGSSVLSKGKLYVSSQRYNDDYSIDLEKSGIEVVDLATKTSEVLATGTELGGGANGIALDEASQILYASVYEYYGSAPVKPINLSSKSVGTALQGITDSFNGLVFDDESKKLFIADASGLKIYDTATKTTIAVDEGKNALPPYSLAIVRW